MEDSIKLTDKVIVVVGGAGLIGSALVRAAVSAGASVVIADKDKKSAESLRGELVAGSDGTIVCEQVDITDPSSVERMARAVGKKFAHINGIVIASYPKNTRYGVGPEDVTFADFSEHLTGHVAAAFHTTRTLWKLMDKKDGGSIVFFGSIYGVVAPRFDIYTGTTITTPAEYAAGKGAILQLMRYLASYLGPRNIRVNAISPGGIFADQPKQFVRAYSRHVRIGTGLLAPDDVSGTLLYLLSDFSKKVTGQNIVVDAGWTL